jgi:hypothetical protein
MLLTLSLILIGLALEFFGRWFAARHPDRTWINRYFDMASLIVLCTILLSLVLGWFRDK